MKTASQCVNSQTHKKRGSALLIVLGLLGFLMISAVAFSITMRTEYKAAAAYRKNVIARDLIATAFAEAQYAVELSMERSAEEMATMSRNEKRRREYLVPFKDESDDLYGRWIASANDDSSTDMDIAYLLDETVMKHIPPYIAHEVFHVLEGYDDGQDLDNFETDLTSRSNLYAINTCARWRPIVVSRPEVDVSETTDNQVQTKIKEEVIGRMAWAVINVSDSLDINGIGSASEMRGLGLTGNEFSYSNNGLNADGLFPSDADFDGIPQFATIADFYQYAAKDPAASDYLRGVDDPIYSWVYAASDDSEDIRLEPTSGAMLSPFTTYSFWPDINRGKTSNNLTAAFLVTEDKLKTTDAGCLAEVYFENDKNNDAFAKLAQTTSGSGGDETAIRNSFLRLLGDYVDENTVPTYDSIEDGFRNHKFPCAENVPMVNEVYYDASNCINEGSIRDSEFITALSDEIRDVIDNAIAEAEPAEIKEWKTLGDIDKNAFKKFEVKLSKDALSLLVNTRAYYPSATEKGSYSIAPEGFVTLSASLHGTAKDTKEIVAVGQELDGATASDISTNLDDTFSMGEESSLAAKGDLTLELDLSEVPVAVDGEEKEVTIRCLVDFFFRVKIEGEGDIVDCVPAGGRETKPVEFKTYESQIKDADDRTSRMADLWAILDGQHFRVTSAFEVNFSIFIRETLEGKKTTFASNIETPTVKIRPIGDGESKEFGATRIHGKNKEQASILSISPEKGTWFAIDPRYNWLPPMYGSRSSASSFVSTEIYPNYSSPHWFFVENEELVDTPREASKLQKEYQDKHATIVPFAWGLDIADVRYNTNDTGTLLLPLELAFLPIPKAESDWTPTCGAYNVYDITKYYEDVAEESYFRTIPFFQLSGNDPIAQRHLEAYRDIINSFTSFTGLPEEHRSIMNVYAGQDNYALGQQLRRLALKGIPSSIKDAIAISSQRLQEAADANRGDEDFATAMANLNKKFDGKAPTTVSEKYDTFINEYLCPISEDADTYWADDKAEYIMGNVRRPQNALDPLGLGLGTTTEDDEDDEDDTTSQNDTYFADLIKAYNTNVADGNSSDTTAGKLGQNDITNLVAFSRECFGDRQQLFLYIMRVDTTTSASKERLNEAVPTSTTRAVALVWRDAYGELPQRIIYFTLL